MAISKERLEQLIKQGATIYNPDTLWNDVGELKANKTFKIKDGRLDGSLGDLGIKGAMCSCFIPLEELFETEEEAQEYLEFGNVTRTEKLILPTWKEMEERLDKKQIDEKYFYYAKHFLKPNTTNVEDTYSIYLLINGNIVIDDDKKCKTLFDKPLTKGNYYEARRLCVRLFKGE